MLLLLLLFLGTVSATTNYFVSLTGNDSADGSSHNSPFKSVAKCLSVASVDGTCFLNGGRYDLEMYPLSINQDITLAADPQSDNGRPILDGSQLVQTTWKQSSQQKCVYRSTALSGSPVSQLWSSGMSKPTSPPSPSAQLDDFSPLTPARFPNALLHDDSVFDGHPTNTNGSLLYSKRTSSSGNIYDSGTHIPSLESSGIDFTGMIAVLPLGTMGMLTQGVVIEKHGKGMNSFTYTPPPNTDGKGHLNIPYYIEGSCQLLDAEGEWCITKSTDETDNGNGTTSSYTISVWLENCVHPSTVSLRGKVHDYLIHVTKRNTKVSLNGIVLWGGTLNAPQVELSLNQVLMAHPSATRYVSGISGMTAAETILKLNQKQGSITMINSTQEWSQSITPFDKIGMNPYFSDNLFLRQSYNLGLSASVGDEGKSRDLIFQHNTIALFNAFTGITPGLTSTVAYNVFSRQTPFVDGAAIHVHIEPQNGCLLFRNWAHDLTVKAFRFDRVNSATAAWGVNGTAVENVGWRCGAACFKGDSHHIVNNTFFDSTDDLETAALFVMMYDPSKSWSIKGENAHTRLTANAADTIFNVSGVLPGIHTQNVGDVSIRSMLVDPEKNNFRPITNTAMDRLNAGAYNSNDNEQDYWIPGRRTSSGVGGGSSDVDCFEPKCQFWQIMREKLGIVLQPTVDHLVQQ